MQWQEQFQRCPDTAVVVHNQYLYLAFCHSSPLVFANLVIYNINATRRLFFHEHLLLYIINAFFDELVTCGSGFA